MIDTNETIQENNLNALIRALLDDTQHIQKVYTFSKAGRYTTNVMDSMIREHPEWANTLQMLSIHPVQHWAAVTRKSLLIDADSINSLIENDDMYFGISTKRSIENQQKVLLATDKALELIDKTLSRKTKKEETGLAVLQYIHGSAPQNGQTITDFYIHKYYEDELCRTCELLSPKINKILKPIEKELALIDEDMQLLYHDADMLVRICGDMHGKGRRHRRYAQIDYEQVYLQMKSCIYALKTYPFDGKDMFDVVYGYFNNDPEARIAERIGRSRTYVRHKYEEGVKVLGYLIWGYATPQILRSDL